MAEQLSMQAAIASIFPSHWQCSLSSWATCCLCMLRFGNEDRSMGGKWDKSRAPLSLRFSCRVNGCLFVKDPGFRAGRKDKCGLRQLASDWLGSDQQRLSSFGSMSLEGTNFCTWVMWINITNLLCMCLVISETLCQIGRWEGAEKKTDMVLSPRHSSGATSPS